MDVVDSLPLRQKIFAITASVIFLLVVIQLVRRRHLKGNYSLLWILTSVGMLAVVLWYELLVYVTRFIGAVLPTSTLFLGGLLFLLAVSVHFSILLSKKSARIKNLVQELALLQNRLERLERVVDENASARRDA